MNFLARFKKIYQSFLTKFDEKHLQMAGCRGRQEWNDRYGSLQQSVKAWQKGCVGLLILSLILTGACVKLALASRVQPFVVPMQGGVPCAILPMTTISSEDPRLIRFAIEQFIINARTMASDPYAQKTLLDKVYAYSANETLGFLKDYYEKNNPLELKSYTKSVEVINALALSSQTWQVMWKEVKQDASGEVQDETYWMAHITIQFSDVNPRFMQTNPFGLYVTHITWSEIQKNDKS
jgi:type IV secretion system protein VirB5